jgi:hypothetical protein
VVRADLAPRSLRRERRIPEERAGVRGVGDDALAHRRRARIRGYLQELEAGRARAVAAEAGQHALRLRREDGGSEQEKRGKAGPEKVAHGTVVRGFVSRTFVVRIS